MASQPSSPAERGNDDPGGRVRVFVGTDENQVLAYQVLAASIRRHAGRAVEITPLDVLEVPEPRDPALRSRTGFTFHRFAIPAHCGYRGRAIYLDADMLVFSDIGELWRWPMPGPLGVLGTAQETARGRLARYAVLLMDCARLDWDVEALIADLEAGRYSYEKLVYELGFVPDEKKGESLPRRWNSLERYQPGETALLHYTDMPRQPWVYPYNRNGGLWYAALREALEAGEIAEATVAQEINAGHVSPDLPRWIGHPIAGILVARRAWLPPYLRRLQNQRSDRSWKLRCALRRRTTWAPWFHRIRDRLRGIPEW
ncbi:MAG: hypothetical protein WD341_16825 [Tistlia sp.]|uniref:hypothetical protein n=1 Tax=Tistlia sp. TaxID=3057121 RepID=UPI0034A51502